MTFDESPYPTLRQILGMTDDQLVALDQAAPQPDIEQAQYILPCKACNPGFELVQIAIGIGGPNETADRAAAHDIGHHALPNERPQYADMRPAPRRTAAQRKA